MTSYLQDTKQRIVAMQKELSLTNYPNGVEAVPYFFFAGATFPYWTNRIGIEQKDIYGQDESARTYDFVMRYVIGHFTEQTPGAVEDMLDQDIPVIEDYFDTHRFLQSLAYPTAIAYGDPIGNYMSMSSGLAVFSDSGISVRQIGVEFTLKLKFSVTTEPAY